MKRMILISAVFLSSAIITACGAHKVVTAPAKVAYNTAKFAGKSVYYTGKGVLFIGKGVYKTGEGVYYIGMTPVRVFDGALDRADRVVRFTGTVVDTANKVQKFSKILTIDLLEDELKVLEIAGKITVAVLKRASDKDAQEAKDAGLIERVDGRRVSIEY